MEITSVAPARSADGRQSNDLEDVTNSCAQCGTKLIRTKRPLSSAAQSPHASWPLAERPYLLQCKGEKHYATKKLGRYRCGNKDCRKYLTVLTGAVVESSHAKLRQWATAFWLGASGKKSFSSINCIARSVVSTTPLGSYIIAPWKRCGAAAPIIPPMSGEGEIVEAEGARWCQLRS
jgi:hypothetical protein